MHRKPRAVRKPSNGDAARSPHALRDQQRMVNRVRRLRGQVDAIERALTEEASCSDLIQRVTAARGAIDGLMAEVTAFNKKMQDAGVPYFKVDVNAVGAPTGGFGPPEQDDDHR